MWANPGVTSLTLAALFSLSKRRNALHTNDTLHRINHQEAYSLRDEARPLILRRAHGLRLAL
jgi:hypothetical protein